MHPKVKKALRWAAAVHGLVLVLALLLVLCVGLTRDLPDGHRVGDCLLRDATGFYCPGCGGTRSLLALLRLDPVTSFLAYPLIPIVCLMALYSDGCILVALLKNDPRPLRLTPPMMYLAVPVLLVLQFILRNLLAQTVGFDPLSQIPAP